MAISRAALLCTLVLATGLFLTVSSLTIPTPEEDFDAWVARNQAKYETQNPESTVLGTETLPGGDFSVEATPSPPQEATCIRTVGKKGSGAKYTKVKAAIKSIPKGNSVRCVIRIAKGFYKEKIEIPKNKPYITIEGAGAGVTILSYGDTAEEAGSTSQSASFAVMSDYFVAKDLTFENSSPPPPGGAVGQQAVAFRIEGDKAQFYRVAFLGAQDTLYDKQGRHYFKDCYIQGSIDFVFGDGQSYYETCHLHSIANPGSGSLTAQKKMTKAETSGFSFVRCNVTGNGPIYIGRAWGPYSRVVLLYTDISAPIIPAGWYNWGDPAREKTVYYGQYKCTGVGADTKGRVNWSKELTDAQARPFLSWDFVDGKQWIGKY